MRRASDFRRQVSAILLLTLLPALPALVSAQDDGQNQRDRSRPERSAKGEDGKSSMTLNLNNVPIDQVVAFISKATGKPVIKQKDIQQQITITSPRPMTSKEALNLIYDALLMENIFVIEQDNQIQILRADAIKNMKVRIFGIDEDIQQTSDSLQIAQKVYHLKNLSADNIKSLLGKFLPDSVMSIDTGTNTLMLTDQITRLKSYDRIVKTLDRTETGDQVIEVFKLENADAVELAAMLGNLFGTQNGQNAPPGRMNDRARAMLRNNRPQGRNQPGAGAVTSGEFTFIPDTRMNWLVVSCPKDRMTEVANLIADVDKKETIDVQTRVIEVKHVEARSMAGMVTQLFTNRRRRNPGDEVTVVPSDDGRQVIVLSSQDNFDLIKELVVKLDTADAEKRESRTYTIKHLEVQDLADQLTTLYQETQNDYYGYFFGGGRRNTRDTTEPSFVPSPRTNTLMVLARPKDFAFIEDMIKELDVPMDSGTFEPRIYHIRHTDAGEMVKMLEQLFGMQTSAAGRRQSDMFFWRPSSRNSNTRDPLEAQFGSTRFVVDTVTNTIVALSSNPSNYLIIDKLVEKLDQPDPDATEVLVVELKYADVTDVANHINNLFSEGPVQQPNQGRTSSSSSSSSNQNSNPSNNNSTSSAEDSSYRLTQEVRTSTFYWQGGGSRTGRQGTTLAERPVNSMIGNVRVVPDFRSNKLIVATPTIFFESLKQLVGELDKPEPQVNITARIVEIARGDERRLGVRWTPDPNSIDPVELENAMLGLGQLGFLNSYGSHRSTPFSVDSNQVFGGIDRTITKQITEPGNTILAANVNIALLVQLLLKNSNSRIVTEPNLTVNNNEIGNIFVGSEYPFRTNSQITDRGGITYGIEYRQVGISLDIQPHINMDGEIVLAAALENSKVRDQLIDGQLIKDLRKFRTEMAVDTGQTMVIGGILVQDEGNLERRVPILGRIPIVNWAFKKTDVSNSVRELVFFITPRILETRADDETLLREYRERIDRIEKLDHAPKKDRIDDGTSESGVPLAPPAPPAAAPSTTAPSTNGRDAISPTGMGERKGRSDSKSAG